MLTRKLSIVAAALSHDAREAARLSRELKLSGLLFDAWSPSLNIPSLSTTGLREFRNVLATQDQTLVGLSAQIGNQSLGRDADVDRLLSRFDELLRAGAALAAEVICLDLGALPEPAEEIKLPAPVSKELAGLILLPDPVAAPPPVRPIANAVDASEFARVNEAMTAFGAVADRYRMAVAFSCSLSSVASLAAALSAAACPWFGVNFDTVDASRDRWPLDETFSRVGSLIRHVRVRDAKFGSYGKSRPVLVGEGNVEWNSLLASIDATDYSGWFTIDPMELSDRSRAVEKAIDLLRDSIPS